MTIKQIIEIAQKLRNERNERQKKILSGNKTSFGRQKKNNNNKLKQRQ